MENFLKLLDDPSPGFICEAAGRQAVKPPKFSVRIRHEMEGPATPEELAQLSALGAEALAPFYARHNGGLFFTGPSIHPQAISGFRLYPISEIENRTANMRSDVDAMGIPEDAKFDFQKSGTAIGEICSSGNYFVIHEGIVFYSDHDGGDDTPAGPSFAQFLDGIAADPAQFLFKSGCYTRYSDGATPTQWIPETYLPAM